MWTDRQGEALQVLVVNAPKHGPQSVILSDFTLSVLQFRYVVTGMQ
jgi:hypothetical protein